MTIGENIRKENPLYATLRDKELSKALADAGTCSHYPGYICDKNWSSPFVCQKCLLRWIRTKSKQPLPAAPKGE